MDSLTFTEILDKTPENGQYVWLLLAVTDEVVPAKYDTGESHHIKSSFGKPSFSMTDGLFSRSNSNKWAVMEIPEEGPNLPADEE